MTGAHPGTSRWSDTDVERIIAALLIAGLALATVLVGVGATIYLINYGGDPPDYQIFRGEPPDLREVGGILGRAAEWRGRGIIQLGLLVLLATPVLRVAFSIVAFARERDRLYVAVTSIVLAVLLYSIVFGHG